MKHKFYVGQTLIATDPCTLEDHPYTDALVIGKSYKIEDLSESDIIIKSEEFDVHEFPFEDVFDFFKLDNQPRYVGSIEPLRCAKAFWMVAIENGYTPIKKHESYEEALAECQRLSKKENKTAWVLKAETQVEQIPYVIQLK